MSETGKELTIASIAANPDAENALISPLDLSYEPEEDDFWLEVGKLEGPEAKENLLLIIPRAIDSKKPSFSLSKLRLLANGSMELSAKLREPADADARVMNHMGKIFTGALSSTASSVFSDSAAASVTPLATLATVDPPVPSIACKNLSLLDLANVGATVRVKEVGIACVRGREVGA